MSMVEPLQKALYDALSNDSTLIALLGGAHIYDDIPRDGALPMIAFLRGISRDWSASKHQGFECRFVLEIRSKKQGWQECQQISKRVSALLESQTLSLDDYFCVLIVEQSVEYKRPRRSQGRQALITYRAYIEKNEEI